jgi:hypothetical protein
MNSLSNSVGRLKQIFGRGVKLHAPTEDRLCSRHMVIWYETAISRWLMQK